MSAGGWPLTSRSVNALVRTVQQAELAERHAKLGRYGDLEDEARALRNHALAELADRHVKGLVVPPEMLRRIDLLLGAQWRQGGDQ